MGVPHSFLGWCRGAGLALFLAALPALADYSVKIDPQEDRGLWEGWGCSLCWWGNAIGGGPYEGVSADLVFGNGSVDYAGGKVPGLGLNIVRYNVGGCGQGGGEVVSPKMPWYKRIDGYWLDRARPDPDGWDWSRDARQRRLLLAACRRGADRVEFFANAPMWWMMDSRSSAGGKLLEADEQAFARYLAAVVARAARAGKMAVTSVEPFNEPQAWWWTYPQSQEGCSIPKEQQARVLGHLRSELDRLKLPSVEIAAADENSMNAARGGYAYLLEQGAAKLVGRVNVHSYVGLKPCRDNAARGNLRQAAAGKRLWMSEYGDGESDGLALARTILDDLNHLRPSAWIYWQPIEPDSAWGLVNADFGQGPEDAGRGKPLRVYPKYYVFAQFTRFLRPGCRLVGGDDPNSVVAYDPARGRIVAVTLNETPQRIHYDLSRFHNLGASAEVTCTRTDGTTLFATTTVPVQGQGVTLEATGPALYSLVVKGKAETMAPRPPPP